MAKKKNPENRRLPYTSEIRDFGEQQGLTTFEVLALIIFRSYMQDKNSSTCWVSLDTLAGNMRCSRSTAKRAVASLKKNKLISIGKKRIRKGGLDNNEYRFLNVHRFTQDPSIGSHRPYDRFTQDLCIGSEGTYTIGSQRTSIKTIRETKKKPSSIKADDDENFSSSFQTKGKLSIESWLDLMDKENPDHKNQVEEYVTTRTNSNIDDPKAFRIWLLTEIKEGREKDFVYVPPPTPEELAAERIKEEAEAKQRASDQEKYKRDQAARKVKLREFDELFDLLCYEDKELIGPEVENDGIPQDHLKIRMLPKLKKLHEGYPSDTTGYGRIQGVGQSVAPMTGGYKD